MTFIATGEARDEDMAARIAAHRAARPPEWETIEEPYALSHVLEAIDPARAVVIDCLSLWVANALERGDGAEEILVASGRAADLAASRTQLTVAVSNEVGLGVVPATPLGRVFRDLLGAVNGVWMESSARALFVVAGRVLPLLAAHEVR